MPTYKSVSRQLLSRVSQSFMDKKEIMRRVEQDAALMIPKKMAHDTQSVIMMVDQDSTMHVAMANPWDLNAIADLEYFTQHRVAAYETSQAIIDELIEDIYREQFSEEVVLDLMEMDNGRAQTLEGEQQLEDIPIIHAVSNLIRSAYESNASDIHVEPAEEDVNVRYRIDGILYERATFPKSKQSELLSRIKILARMNIAEKREPQDGRFTASIGHIKLDVRVSSLPTYFGEKIVMRLLRKADLNLRLQELGMQDHVLENYKRQVMDPRGLILITGPTGSGKTTSLYSTLSYINETNRKQNTQMNVVTVEDPVEYQLKGIFQVQVDNRKGITFASGLRTILRQDPDIILVGEIRDLETAEMAVQAALTGHLVFSTLHTNDAASSVVRLMDLGIERFLVLETVKMCIAQRLARKICPRCRNQEIDRHTLSEKLIRLGQIDRNMIAQLVEHLLPSHDARIFGAGSGCDLCNNTGYYGRDGIYEVIDLSLIRSEIPLEGTIDTDTVKKIARKAGMKGLLEIGLEKVRDGQLAIDEVIRVCGIEGLSEFTL